MPFTSLSQEWRTPRAVFDDLNKEFAFNCDPCPTQSLIDGLEADWGGRTFVNPPFKTIEKWARKAFEEAAKGKLVVMLIPSRTDTRWWHDYIMKASDIRFIKGRLKYEGARYNAPFPSCVVVFDRRTPKEPS